MHSMTDYKMENARRGYSSVANNICACAKLFKSPNFQFTKSIYLLRKKLASLI